MNDSLRSIAFVLQWHPDCVVGGAETQSWLIAKELVFRGWKVSYISEWPHKRSYPKVIDGIRLFRLPYRRSEFTYLNFFHLLRVMSGMKANLYYQRVVNAYTGMVVKNSHLLGAKSVWACSSILDCEKNRLRMMWENNHDLRRWSRRLFKLPFICLVDRISEYGILNVDQIIVQSQEQNVALSKNWGRESMVVPNAHPVKSINIEKSTPPEIIWLGSIKPIKRPLMFVDLARRCNDINAHFIMAGAPTDRVLSNELSNRLSTTPNVTYLGLISSAEANKLIERASLLVNTSSNEGFPNTFIQAWLRSTPVISLEVDPDRVINRNSLGTCSGNFDKLVADVKNLLANPFMLKNFGKICRNYAFREHNLNRVMNIYEELFLGLLDHDMEIKE